MWKSLSCVFHNRPEVYKIGIKDDQRSRPTSCIAICQLHELVDLALFDSCSGLERSFSFVCRIVSGPVNFERAAGRMFSEEDQFNDARDWEKELQNLREKVRAEKRVVREERKKNE